MGKFNCKCGNILSTSGEIPNPIEWLLISDKDYDSFSDKIDAEDLYLKMKTILKCPNCGRLWIFWNGVQEEPSCYFQEK